MFQLITRARSIPDWLDQSGNGATRVRSVRNSTGAVLSESNSTKLAKSMLSPSRPRGSQITKSESHSDWGRSIHKDKTFFGDIGGPFYSKKSCVSLLNPGSYDLKAKIVGSPNSTELTYHGPVYAAFPWLVTLPSMEERNLAPLGTTAIARCKPTNNVADVSVFLAELYSDGLPKLFGATLWQKEVLNARSAGEEYLNSEFGWKPMVSDVEDIVQTVTHARDALKQYERGSGRMTRRRYEFPIEVTSSESSPSHATEILSNRGVDDFFDKTKPTGITSKITKTWRRTWFSGAFTYHMPSGYRSRNALMKYGSKADALLGTALTPDTLWNAMPWSWAIDWFSNAGDVISNLSDWATDGLVLKYGYIMEHTIITDLYYKKTPDTFQTSGVFPSPVVAYVETKRREVATPFGFEVSWGGLSLRQLSIASALGLTRR